MTLVVMQFIKIGCTRISCNTSKEIRHLNQGLLRTFIKWIIYCLKDIDRTKIVLER
jgi:hypothetical protein